MQILHGDSYVHHVKQEVLLPNPVTRLGKVQHHHNCPLDYLLEAITHMLGDPQYLVFGTKLLPEASLRGTEPVVRFCYVI